MAQDQIQVKDLSRIFASAEETENPEQAQLKGKLPEWLQGKIFQTGPGLFDLPNFTMNDYLDGYAIISKFSISPSSISLQKKYPETESYRKAIELGKPYFLEYGTTAKREGRIGLLSKLMTTLVRDDMSDNCSSSVYPCGDSLIASSATSFFSKINPESLIHEQRFDGKKYLGQNGYGVHPLMDEEGTLWNMGFSAMPTIRYNVVKIPNANSQEDIEKLLQKGSVVATIAPRWTGALSFNHSFGMTKNYIVFIEQPYVIKVSRVLAATIKDYALKEWLEWRPQEKSRFYLIDKKTGKVNPVEYLSSESFFFLHVTNCYEDEERIVVDVATSKTPSSSGATCLSKLRNSLVDKVDPWIIQRFIIPLTDSVKSLQENSNLLQSLPSSYKTAEAKRMGNSISLTPEIIFARGADRAIINPLMIAKKHKFIYASGTILSLAHEDSAMAHSICKVNVDTKQTEIWSGSENDFTSEPIFIPNQIEANANGQDEDDGVLVCAASSSSKDKKDYLVIIDGKTFKEIARAEFNSQIPIGMHGVFIS